MRKGVAVPYIIAILLGVAVIGLIGYWLFFSGGRLGGSASDQQCRSDFLQACQSWASTGYTSGDNPPDKGVFKHEDDNECMKLITGKSRTADVTRSTYMTICSSAGT